MQERGIDPDAPAFVTPSRPPRRLPRIHLSDLGHERAWRQVRYSATPARSRQGTQTFDVLHPQPMLRTEMHEPRDHPVQAHHPDTRLTTPAPPPWLDVGSKWAAHARLDLAGVPRERVLHLVRHPAEHWHVVPSRLATKRPQCEYTGLPENHERDPVPSKYHVALDQPPVMWQTAHHRSESVFDHGQSPAVVQMLTEQLERLGRVPGTRVRWGRDGRRRLGNRGLLFRAVRWRSANRYGAGSLGRRRRGCGGRLLRRSGRPLGFRSRRPLQPRAGPERRWRSYAARRTVRDPCPEGSEPGGFAVCVRSSRARPRRRRSPRSGRPIPPADSASNVRQRC